MRHATGSKAFHRQGASRVCASAVSALLIITGWAWLAPTADAQRFGRGEPPRASPARPSPPRKEYRPSTPVPPHQYQPRHGRHGGHGGREHFSGYPIYPWWAYPTDHYPGYFPGVIYPPDFGAGPGWAPLAPLGYPNWYPQSILLETEVVAGQPLPPARVQLRNSAKRELEVTVTDLIDPDTTESFRIPPGEEVRVTLQRDSGYQEISRYQTYDALGFPVIQEVVTDLPPQTRYEVVVHEWAVQSVAIDRTGKSPDPIEDINMQGRGIGRFTLPAGEELRSGTIDVYQMALAAANPGAVAPLVPEEDVRGDDKASILERAILDAQRRAQQQPRRRGEDR